MTNIGGETIKYIENPKTKGSGIKCCIPQSEPCRVGCKDCFFMSGKSYLEPLAENLPNLPPPEDNVVYRINDGNDSSMDIDTVLKFSSVYAMRFYNTSLTYNMERFNAPVVLTVNPGVMTNEDFHQCDSDKIMYVRLRLNTWNFGGLGKECIMWYAERKIPIVITFMRYSDVEDIPKDHLEFYERKIHVENEYWSIRQSKERQIMRSCENSPFAKYIHVCGTRCRDCGNCLKLYFAHVHGGKE